MNRKEKIQALKAIATGQTTVQEQLLTPWQLFVQDEQGLYSRDGKTKLTSQDYKEYRQKHPARITVVLKPAKGNQPIYT